MKTQSFQEQLRASGPDTLKTPAMSREERLTKFMPRPVVEMLEGRRLMTLETSLGSGTLTIEGTSGADYVSISIGGDNSLHISDGTSTTYPVYDPNQVSLIKLLLGDGADSNYINSNVSETCEIHGDAGNDVLNGGGLSDSIYGGTGNDNIAGAAGADAVYGEAGTDSVNAGDGNDTVYGGDDADTINGDAQDDIVYGGPGDDRVFGGEGNDTCRGDDGDDSMVGQNGDEELFGGNGYDTLEGGEGSDTLRGEADNDLVDGGLHSDSLFGGDGTDTLKARDNWVDVLDGGAGSDCASIDNTLDTNVINVEGFYP